jgi:hypothetical protein
MQPGAAKNQNWDSKHIDEAVKTWIKNHPVYKSAFETTVNNLSSHNDDVAMFTGDGFYNVTLRTGLVVNAFHKRFHSNELAVIYNYGPRRDGQGRFLNVIALAEHHGRGNAANNYRLVTN